MKLSRLYSNRRDLFEPIDFVAGLNVVIAEIRVPENRTKDTHNLGKTTLGRLLDFVFLLGRDPGFFLFKHEDLFSDFVFFLEIEIQQGYITVRRGVEESSKISFKKHARGRQDFTAAVDSEWDHFQMPFERARDMMDSLLDWRGLKPWPYRKALGYLLRSQEDFQDVFQLGKFVTHSDWKPFVADLLGFDADLLIRHYAAEDRLREKEATALTINQELGGSIQDVSKVEGMLLLKQRDAEKRQAQLDAFDFRSQDKQHTKQLVDSIDEQIGTLNARRYSLNQNRKKILSSLNEENILFDPDEARILFEEAGVLFQGQIKKDFEQLIEFNRAISDERRGYLQEDLSEIEEELKIMNAELNALGKSRSESLAFLSSTDAFVRYKKLADELVLIRADITGLERQRTFLARLQELRTEIRGLTEEIRNLQSQIEVDVERQNADKSSAFSTIRLFFSEIVESVIDRKALISVSPNGMAHLEFKAEILDNSGNATSAHLGHTYKKLLCIAFDMAVLRGHIGERFPRFMFHDGAFESLDDRKKENLLAELREYASIGLQPIITLIDSDLPKHVEGQAVFDDSEIVLRLHDEGDSGRLFKMASW